MSIIDIKWLFPLKFLVGNNYELDKDQSQILGWRVYSKKINK